MAQNPKTERFILNCIPSMSTETDWSWEAALEAGAVMRIRSSNLPAEVDLRSADWPVRNQEDTGACVGFSTADGLLRYHYQKSGLTKGFKEMPSPRFIWMADKETDAITDYPTTFIESVGTQVKHALDIARRYGSVMEEDLPMSGGLWSGSLQAFYTKAARYRIATYNNLGVDLKVWRKWLATNGPILTRLGVDQTWDNITGNGKLETYFPATQRGGHAVCIVGYKADGGFIVRNSWGAEWGDKGFAYASASYAQDAFTEAYGVIL